MLCTCCWEMDGRFGTNPGFPTGDTLVKLRQQETDCACENFGIKKAYYLGFSDDLARMETPAFMEQMYYLKQKIKEKIQELNPDVILTFGPDGDIGQSDHRLISNATTEVILNEGWDEKFDLYYLAWTQKDADKLKQILGFGLNTVHSKYYNVSIKYNEDDEAKMIKSLSCYKSQLTDNEVQKWQEVEKLDGTNTIHFRKFTVNSTTQTDF